MLDLLIATFMFNADQPSASLPSAYRGQYYSASEEGTRQCIATRESEGNRTGTGGNGRYEGPYQMLSPLVVGATWMMQPELRKMYGRKEGTRIARHLRATPLHKWDSPFFQDMAFWTVYSWKGTASGAKHWAGGRWSCPSGMAEWSR